MLRVFSIGFTLAVVASGCGLMGLFDEDPAGSGEPCTPNAALTCVTVCGSTGTAICPPSGRVPPAEECEPPAETCDGRDQDCDTVADNGFDCARDTAVACTTACGTEGTGTCTPSCQIPGAAACIPPEEICNGEDDDCDGGTDDGFSCAAGAVAACTTTCGTTGTGACTDACEPAAAAACDPPVEACNNEVDDDCDGETDEISPEQCEPGTTVACHGPCDPAGERLGSGICTDACLPPEGEACTAPDETCNGRDDDCDTLSDEDFACTAGQAAPCTTTCGSNGTGTCLDVCLPAVPGACIPPAETCNGLDDDCVGGCDNGFECCAGASGTCITGCGTTGTRSCGDGCLWSDCEPPAEACNNADDDCDTVADEDFECARGTAGACDRGGCPGTHYCSTACAWEACIPPSAAMTEPPRPVFPANGIRTGSHLVAANLRPTVGWRPVTPACGAVRYHVQIDDSCPASGFAGCAFPSPAVDVDTLTDTSHRPDAPLEVDTASRPFGRRYFWRVRACDVFDRCTPWSAVRYLDVGRETNDFNGDGYADVLVGAGGYNGSRGRAYVYFGRNPWPIWGLPLTPSLTIEAGTLWGFGFRASGAGDVNGDGYADFAVGTGGSNRILLFLGGASPDATADVTLNNGETGFGHAVAGVGDVNGDGYADVLAGALGAMGPTMPRGAAYLYLGGATPDAVIDLTLSGDQNLCEFGVTVAGAGDFDGDGFVDLAVGSQYYDQVGVGDSVGRVSVFLGGPTPDATVDLQILGEAAGHRFGYSLGWAGDVNGDRHSDLIVGAWAAGRAYVQLGGSPPSAASRWILYPPESCGFGKGVSGTGDFNGDGYHDVQVGCPDRSSGAGMVYLFLGGISAPTASAASRAGTATGGLGSILAALGDTTGDGLDDCAWGQATADPSGVSDAGSAHIGIGITGTFWRWPQDIFGTASDEGMGSSFNSAPPF
jgi:hypothetical protein